MFSIAEKIIIKFFADRVGKDRFANEYYVSKKQKNYQGKNKRFVLYKNDVEPTKIDTRWYLWLHHLSDILPSCSQENNRLIRMPNLTGTSLSYTPLIYKNEVSKNEKIFTWRPNGKQV